MKSSTWYVIGIVAVVVVAAGAFFWFRQPAGEGEQVAGESDALIAIDGSSTVYPITEAVAEEWQRDHASRVTVGISGTGGGFKKFCAGETDIADASRPIKDTEIEQCEANGISFVELPVAFDGIAVMVHPSNTWVDQLTVSELKTMWEPLAQGVVMRWSDVREGWPDEELHLYGPGIDSGTFDYFTDAIVGEEGASRGDFTSSEDDNVLVQGIASDRNSLGFFGVAYYEENADKLKLVPVDDEDDSNGTEAIEAEFDAILNGDYQPLSRPIFIYVSMQAGERSEVSEFVEFYLAQADQLVREVGYIPLPGDSYQRALAKWQAGTIGTAFSGGSQIGVTIDDLLQ